MANTTISALSAAGSIDGGADYFPIDTASPNATNKINRSTFLGVSGQPADISTVQTFTNKVIGNTNTATLKDTLFTLQDDGDTTKQARFQLSSITTATTRTYTLPNATTTLVGTDVAQTLTNKTITSPAITGGTIANSTVTVDAISGFTSSTIVTVAGLQISSGVLNTSNSVVTASVADSAITPAKLQTGTGSGWTLQSWTPTFTNLTVGNGTLTAAYVQIGKIVFFRVKLVFGSTTSIAGSVDFTLPVNSNAAYQGAESVYIGLAKCLDAGNASVPGYIQLASGSATKATVIIPNVSATYPTAAALASTAPFTWALSDELHAWGSYEGA